MPDSNFLKYALIGGGAYLLYQTFLKPSTAAAQASASPSAPGPAPAPPAAPPPAPIAFNTLDATYQRFVANLNQNVAPFKANPTGFTATPYGWNFWLAQVTQEPAGLDFSAIFGADVMASEQSSQMTLSQFWSKVAPWLQKNAGLTGFGGGMAGLILSRRRA